MNMVLTIVVNPNDETLLNNLVSKAKQWLLFQGVAVREEMILSKGEAHDINFMGRVDPSGLKTVMSDADWAVQPIESRKKSMLIADMDSTMIYQECIDELADFVGKKDHVAEITEKAMQGLIDFNDAIHERVALLKGLPLSTVEQCYKERITLMAGARELVATMNARGGLTVLVSGGFTFFTERVGAELGFELRVANVLGVQGDKLDGTVRAPIVNADTKKEVLETCRSRYNLRTSDIIAVGDGANDIPMLDAAGLGVAYHAKEKAREAADVAVSHGDLTALLFFQGIKRQDFKTST